MNGATARLERKEARRILGDRTASIVGALRQHVEALTDRVEALTKRANAQDDLIALLVSQVGQTRGTLDRFVIRADDDRERDRAAQSALRDRLTRHTEAGWIARLRWLLWGG